MIAILCVDDSFGMLFNNRRQSRDDVLNNKILDVTKNSKLWMNDYSFRMLQKYQASNICVADDFLEEAQEGDFCFIENKPIGAFIKYVEKIILFKWNRSYPRDMCLDVDLSEWNLEESIDFVGKSHEKITMEVYSR